MHVHTKYSIDSLLSLNKLKKICNKKKILPIITDHNTLKGALKFGAKIMGEEVSTKQGEITGLFLQKEIKEGLSIHETIDRIKEQDGLVYLPHPFDRLRKKRLEINSLDKDIWKKIDIIEVFNSRTSFDEDNKKALKVANLRNLLKGVGSDAHLGLEVGKAYIIMGDFNSKREFIKNLKNAKYMCKKSPIFVHAITKVLKLIKCI